MAYFKVLSRHLPAGTEKNYENLSGTLCPNQDSIQALPKYKFKSILTELTCLVPTILCCKRKDSQFYITKSKKMSCSEIPTANAYRLCFK